MRRRIDKEEGFQEAEVVEKWDKKKVIVALVVLILLVATGIFAFTKAKEKATQVLSARTTNTDVKLPTREDADRLLESAKEGINSLTSENLTSSQAAIQKIIQDLQGIQGGKESPTGAFCSLVCGKN